MSFLDDMMGTNGHVKNWSIPSPLFNLLNKKRKSAKKIILIHDSNIPYLSLSKRKYDKRDLFLIYRNEWLICDEVNFGTNKYSVIELPSELEFLIKISARKV